MDRKRKEVNDGSVKDFVQIRMIEVQGVKSLKN